MSEQRSGRQTISDLSELKVTPRGGSQSTLADHISGWVNVRSYGAVGDGVTDDTAAIQAAMNTGKTVVLVPGESYSVTGLTAVEGGALVTLGGRRAEIVLASGGTVALTIAVPDFRVQRVAVEGGNAGPYSAIGVAKGTRTGISIGGALTVEDVLVEDCTVHGFDANGIYVTRTAQSSGGDTGRPVVRLRGVTATENYNGLFLDEYGEYVQITDCNSGHAYAALRMIGGNNRVVNSHFSRSWRNLLMRNGVNMGHGEFVGCSFNHMISGSPVGVDAYNITLGWHFVGCTFWYSNILLQDSGGFLFVGNQIGETTIETSYSGVYNGGTNSFIGNWLYGTVTKTWGASTKVVWDRNITDNLGGVVQLGYSATIAVDASLGEHFAITATNGTAFTISNPTNGTLGQRMVVQIRNTSGGALGAVTWGSAFKMASWTSPATTYNRSVTFQFWNGTWYEVGRTAADVPN